MPKPKRVCGRPIISRTDVALKRDMATIRRLRKSIAFDERVDPEVALAATTLIDKLLDTLLALGIRQAA